MQLRIEKLVSQGFGLALSSEGKQVLVSEVLPGELVDVAVQREHASYIRAAATTIIESNTRRIAAPCPYWGSCGGCDFQYAGQGYQAELKEAIVVDTLRRIGGAEPGSYTLEEQVRSEGWGYRSRARFFVDLHQKRVGFLGRGSNALVEIARCPVLVDPLNALLSDPQRLLAAARRQMFANKISKSGLVEVPAFADNERAVLLDEEIVTTVGGKTFALNSTVFFQSNLLLLPSLGAYVKSLTIGDRVMDLYSGVGTFAAFVQKPNRSVTAVERHKLCLAFARRNAPEADFYTMAAETWAVGQHGRVDTVIVDPPRTGLDVSLPPLIASWQPQRIVYVSCDETSLARDIRRFAQQGYHLRSVRLFDLYPQTFHTESVALLVKA